MIHFLNRATGFAKGFASNSANVFSKRLAISLAVAAGLSSVSFAAIDITIETQKGVKKVSPYLYGRNIDKISDTKVESDSTEEPFISQMLEAGIHMLRANNGNNATRYNWKKNSRCIPTGSTTFIRTTGASPRKRCSTRCRELTPCTLSS